jgi:hypothetical protein
MLRYWNSVSQLAKWISSTEQRWDRVSHSSQKPPEELCHISLLLRWQAKSGQRIPSSSFARLPVAESHECKKRETYAKQRAAMAFDAGWDEAHDTDRDSSDGEDDFMETACSKYMCIIPATWAYYGKTEKQKGN